MEETLEELEQKRMELADQIKQVTYKIHRKLAGNKFSILVKGKYYKLYMPERCETLYFKSTGEELSSKGLELRHGVTFRVTKVFYKISYDSLILDNLMYSNHWELEEITESEYKEKIKDAKKYFEDLLEWT